MNILVLEDDTYQRDRIVKVIEKNYLDYKVYGCSTVKEARKIANEKQIQLFLLDIEIGTESGLEFAKELRGQDVYKLVAIVFITGQIISMLEAFKVIHCYDFLVKPFNDKNILDIVNIFSGKKEYLEKEGKYITVNIDTSVISKIYIEDIIYIEYENRSCKIRTKNELIQAKGYGIKKLIEDINSNKIIQCHKAFAINCKYIDKIIKIDSKMWEVNFWNCDEVVPVGYKYKDLVVDAIK